MDWEAVLRGRAERQEGLVAKFHLPDAGLEASHWWQAIRNDRWEVLSSRVLRLRGTPASDAQRALAAVLDASPGGVLHGPTSLAWFGMRGFDLRRIHVARPRGLSGLRPELGVLHRLRELRAHDVVVSRGVTTETPLRAIWNEAARLSAPPLFEIGLQRVGRLLDDAHVRGLVTWAALHEMVAGISERGRAGTVLMRELARDRQPGTSPTESRNEDRFEQILMRADILQFRRQVVVGGHEPIGRVDYAHEELPLVVEVNGVTYHSSPSDRFADELRHMRLNDAGFTVGIVWEDDLWSRPGAVVDMIRDARKRARNRERTVLHTPACPWPGAT